jgi:uncharacterized protein involved in exopolysaccharide biosynthesis
MNEKSSEPLDLPRPLRDDRMVFLVPADEAEKQKLGIRELWNILWRRKFLIIAITAIFTISAVVYALLAEQWFKAEVVLVPAKKNQNLPGQLGGLAGLASLAGVNIGEKGDTVEALAVLRSNDFVRGFIQDRNLLPILYADEWDSANKRWKASNKLDWPDERDAVRFFQKSICQVLDDKRTGLVTVSIEWKDRAIAADWANSLVARLNERMRQRVLAESEQNIRFLREELQTADIPSLQQSLSRLLENELQNVMVARGSQEFAFRVVDRASVPKWRSRPKRTLLVCVATLGGGILAVALVFLIHAWRQGPPSRPEMAA